MAAECCAPFGRRGRRAPALCRRAPARDRAGDANVEQWASFGLASAISSPANSLGPTGSLSRPRHRGSDGRHANTVPDAPRPRRRASRPIGVGARAACSRNLPKPRRRTRADALVQRVLNVIGFLALCERRRFGGRGSLRSRAWAGRGARAARTQPRLRSLLFEAEAAAVAGLVEAGRCCALRLRSRLPDERPLWLRHLHNRALAARRAADGDLAGAEALLGQSLATDEGAMPLEAAGPCSLLGTVRRRARRRRRPARLSRRRYAVFEEHGATPLAAQGECGARARGRQRGGQRCELSSPRPSRRVASSSPRAWKNKEVAAALFLSVKTVEVTLTRVYRKLGVRSRTSCAAGRDRRRRETVGEPLFGSCPPLPTVSASWRATSSRRTASQPVPAEVARPDAALAPPRRQP